MAGAFPLPGMCISAGIAAPSFWKVGRTWGAAITTAPYATSAAAVARGARRPQGSVFSANTISYILSAMAASAVVGAFSVRQSVRRLGGIIVTTADVTAI